MAGFTYEDFQNLSKHQVEAMTAFASTMTKSLQEIAAETADYSKHAIASNSETVEKLLGAKSVETAMQIQSEYAKTAYEGFVTRATKITEIVGRLASEAIKPAQNAMSAVVAKA